MTGLYERIMDSTSQRCIPFAAIFEVTYACTTDCTHCYLAGRDRRGELTTEEIMYALNQLAEAGVLFLTLSGGEPLVRTDFFDIAGEAGQLDFALRIFTNGTLVNENTARRIAELNPLAVEISLYGAGPGTHDAVTRVRGSFVRTMNGIQRLHDHGVRVNLKAALMNCNQGEYDEMTGIAERLGVPLYVDTQIVPADDGGLYPVSLNMDDSGLETLYRTFLPLHRGERPGAPPQAGMVRRGERLLDQPYCNAGRNSLAVSPYGDIYPCVQIRWKAGNLRERKFGEIWRTSHVLKRLRRLNVRKFGECASCGLFDYCSHCPGVAHLETGNLLGCSPLAKSQAMVWNQVVTRKAS